MNNELLIGICWSAGAFVVISFIVYMEFRRDKERTKRESRKGGKHAIPKPRGVIPTLNPAGRIEMATLPGPLFANVKRLPFPSKPGLHAKSIAHFYERKCGGFDVLQPIMNEPYWYRFDYEPTHTLPYRLRVFNRAHRTGKRKDPTARTMAFATAAKRSKALDAFVAMHLAEAAKRLTEAANRGQANTTTSKIIAASTQVWRRPE